MLEHVGFRVQRQLLDTSTYNRHTLLSHLEQLPESQSWDIALTLSLPDVTNFPVYAFYYYFALDGRGDWVLEQPPLRRLYQQVLGTVNREQQRQLIRQMERHTYEQAYFLFLYNPIQLYAVNKAVTFVPYVNTVLEFDETLVTAQHWSVRKKKAAIRE